MKHTKPQKDVSPQIYRFLVLNDIENVAWAGFIFQLIHCGETLHKKTKNPNQSGEVWKS